MNDPTPAQRLDRICEEGLCIGCGLCQAVAGADKVRVVTTPEGNPRPVAADALDHAAMDRIDDICPGTRLEGLPDGAVDADARTDLIWGVWRRMATAHAADAEVRFKAATGGVLSALAVYLLETGRVDFVVHARASQSHPSFGRRQVSRTRTEVLQGAGSRYGPT